MMFWAYPITIGICAAQTAAALAAPVLISPNKQIIGIHATGPQHDLDRLQAFATDCGFPSKQMGSPDGWELVIVFPPGSNPSAVWSFIGRLRGSEYSRLHFRSAIAPATADGPPHD